MLPRKTRHSYYALLLVLVSIVFSSAVAKTNVHKVLSEVVFSKVEKASTDVAMENFLSRADANETASATAASMLFTTIIQGADEEVGCSNNGFTVARFNLCGDSDDRTITLSGGPYGSVQWQVLGGSCSPDVNEDCPNTNTSCYTTVSTAQSFTLDASSIPAGSGAEFRVVADGQQYFFKVKKSTIIQTYVKRDYICGVDGRIQITNLSSAYEFSIDSGSGFGAWQPSPIFDGLAPGTYVVKARLQNTPNTCEYPYEPIVIEQLDISIDVEFTDAQCFGDTGSITVTVNDVPGPYKYTLLDENGVPQEFTTFITTNPYTFSAVGFGTYSVQVETQQCTGSPPPRQNLDINGNPITIGDGIVALTASTEVNESLSSEPGCGSSSVDIIVRTSGGTAPYTFTVSDGGNSGGSYTTQTTYSVSSAGTYDFTITDANGCIITASANVVELTPPDVSASGIDGDCTNGGAKIDINVIDAKGYNLSFRATPADPWSNDPLLSVSAGTYNNIQVRYQQGGFDCIYTIPTSVTVTSVGAITGNAVKIADRTCDGSGGVIGGIIEFQGPFSGGSGGGYVFSISGDNPSNFSTQTYYDNLAPGTYTPIIRDSGGCRLELTPITILDVDPPTAISFAQSDTNCAAGTSDVQLTATSTNPIVRYEILSPVYIDNGGNDTFDDINTNTAYQFRVTDDQGCTYTDSFTPAVISSIRARVKAGGDFNVCTGATDGDGTFIIDGFANNYTYNINGGPESGPQNNLEVNLPPSGAGNYTITVTDVDTGCQDTATITIQEPATPLSLTGNVTAMSCDNSNIGRVVANATGGWGNYQYTLQLPLGGTIGPKSGRTFGNLTQPGNYILTVEDAEGCTDTFTFTLTPLDAPVIDYDATASDLCYVPGTGATLGVQVTTNGTAGAPYEFRINGGAWQGSPVFPGLSPGNYTIEVRDGNNCRDNVSLTVNPQLRVNASLNTEIPCGGAPGAIDVSVTGGYLTGAGPKQYEVSSDNGTTFGAPVPLTSNNFTYSTATPGTYIFRVTDNEGCVAESSPFVLDPPINIDPASVQVFPPACGETNSGRAIITPDATSGVPPYEISFDGGAFTSQTVYSGLNQGQNYTYIVRDARGCETVPQNFTVPSAGTAPDATVVSNLATCSAGNVEGSIDVTGVTGGTADFTYILQDQFGGEISRIGPTSSTSETFTGLAPDTYRIITLDANGCRDEDLVTVTQTTLDVVPVAPPPPVCDPGGFTYTVDIVGGDGSSGFEIRLVSPINTPFGPVSSPPRRHTFSGFQFGVSYTVEVLDIATGCVYEDIIDPVDGPSPLEVTAVSTAGYCDASRNGQIEYTIIGFAPGSDLLVQIYDVDDGTLMDTQNLTNVITIPYIDTFETLPGNYQVIVTDFTDDCNDGALITIDQNLPSIFILTEEPANCNADGQFTVTGAGGAGGPYEFAFGPSGFTPDYTGAATPADPTDDFGTTSTFIGPAGNYDVYVRDASGCTSFDIATIIQQQVPPVLNTPVVVNQCTYVPGNDFQITVSTPNTTDTPRFTLNGSTQFGVLNGGVYEATFLVTTPGNYPVLLEDADGCSTTGTAEVYEFLSASGEFSVQPSCNNADGEITISTNGGSGDFTFELQDGGGAYIDDNITGTFTGIAPGDYQVLVTDNIVSDGLGNCTFLVDGITLEAATPPVIAAINEEDISCNGADDGSIDVILQAGTDVDGPLTYTLYEAGTANIVQQNSSGSFSGLTPQFYDVEVVTARNCSVRQNGIEIEEPLPFSITASAPDFSCSPGTNTYSSTIITITVVDPGTATGGYQYSITGFENYQSSNTFEIIDNGSPQDITVYAIDGNGCQTTFDVPTINPPTDVVPTLSVVNVLDCANPERVRIDVVGTTDFTIVTNSVVAVPPVNVSGASFGFVDLPAAGDYLFEIVDNTGGCTYPLPKHEVQEPVLPTITILEAKPVSCAVPGDDGELSISVTDYTGTYSYEVFAVDNLGVEISTGITGNLNTANNPETITGLTGGNFVVRVTSTQNPFCSNVSNLATVRAPNGPLVPNAIEVGNVSCNDNTGKIEATLTGGWDVAPYEYRLMLDDGSGTYPLEVATWGSSNEFENLANGDYRVEFRDVEGCEVSFDITLAPIPPIQAGIREPQGLVCPDGNNAVLEAYDPTTGDVITAIPGATGGVPGAGYKYQLIYLGSNNIADEISRSGLQDSPTFTGTSGGFISQGWYAIEISSSYGCLGVTIPYYVDPPPPIIPNLVQVQAPGCGGMGEMRLSIENPEPGFEYEYRPVGSLPTDPFTSMGVGNTSALISGGPGFYQFEVRKVNATNTCGVINSNGLTLVDAQNVDLVVNLPDDISCANETDGRIESFSSGGVGSNVYTLYIGDPIDAFNPSPSATVIASNDFGTFEGLDASPDYYVAVTSGVTCQDIEGPFEVERPAPIIYTASATPVTCSGEDDGTITVEVTSGGVGLIQFAIGPNFNEFFSDPANPGIYTFDELEGDANGREYTILIQDSEGCSETAVVQVFEPQELEISYTSTPEICLGFADGTAQLAITGGTPFVDGMGVEYYEVSMNSSDDADFARNDNLFFDNLLGGESYVFFVRDANGCMSNIVVPIEIGVDINAGAVVEYGCEGIFPNSTTTIVEQNGSSFADVLFSLDVDDISVATTERTWADLPAGDHIVYLYHANGCTTFVEFTIDPYEPLVLEAMKTGPDEITAIATGGFGGYEFFFQGESQGSDNIFNISYDATINIRVRDSQGCYAEIVFPFDFDGMVEFPNFFTPDGDNMNDFWAPKNREFFPNIEVLIYDRYGREVARLDQVKKWDGNYNGKPLPTGDYWYVVNANDNEKQQYVGHFTLYR
ncbi:T9SS type B sorting domain-containing protein [Flagellimonas lutaonensis]|uniref:Outer membrane autotransporter barrel domain protein n=1 Tax=Flagellimonas lutaonensis TaxID=516051 RepID=A0A0D5YPW6_9FLAO|nr:T9SS type B sorting domain-containing protein [Allomuricauda lutaonensis]AKA33918.1 Outer membrane autotransporter barrel domain protein [Allomuricauda lutaonensis]